MEFENSPENRSSFIERIAKGLIDLAGFGIGLPDSVDPVGFHDFCASARFGLKGPLQGEADVKRIAQDEGLAFRVDHEGNLYWAKCSMIVVDPSDFVRAVTKIHETIDPTSFRSILDADFPVASAARWGRDTRAVECEAVLDDGVKVSLFRSGERARYLGLVMDRGRRGTILEPEEDLSMLASTVGGSVAYVHISDTGRNEIHFCLPAPPCALRKNIMDAAPRIVQVILGSQSCDEKNRELGGVLDRLWGAAE